ncbi:MAG: TOBE domain-containing protein, partial [Rhodospirillales bacterium]|nr:TOBE domain-containing protein [Rhodospirillales bacterium]
RPAHADVAEFMGYRNLVPTAAEPAGELVRVQIGGAAFAATPMEPIAGRAVAAIRPEDLSPAAEGAIEITVEAAEYRGRDFYGFGKTRDGTELFFRAEHRVGAGETLRLSPAPGRVLAYAA